MDCGWRNQKIITIHAPFYEVIRFFLEAVFDRCKTAYIPSSAVLLIFVDKKTGEKCPPTLSVFFWPSATLFYSKNRFQCLSRPPPPPTVPSETSSKTMDHRLTGNLQYLIYRNPPKLRATKIILISWNREMKMNREIKMIRPEQQIGGVLKKLQLFLLSSPSFVRVDA